MFRKTSSHPIVLVIFSCVVFATAALAVSPPESIEELAKLNGTGTDFFDLFGEVVAVSGDTAVVGAVSFDGAATNGGGAFVFERNEGGTDAWGEAVGLTASDAALNAGFGRSVTIDGDTVVAGAPGENTTGGVMIGSVYVFERDQGGVGNWGEVKKVTPDDSATLDFFGDAVSLDGDLLAVGAVGDDTVNENAGAVYIFGRDIGGVDNWGQIAKITAADGEENVGFGERIALDGDLLAVGVGRYSVNADRAGAVYVFERDRDGPDNWGLATQITDDAMAVDFFGNGVSLDGDRLVVGSPGNDDRAPEAGAVYVYRRDEGGADNWGRTAKLYAIDAAEGDLLGASVAIRGDTLTAGSFDNDNGFNAGSVYVWSRSPTDTWVALARLLASDGTNSDELGASVAIAARTIVAGAPEDDSPDTQTGSAYVFEIGDVLLADGFESGDTTAWSSTVP